MVKNTKGGSSHKKLARKNENNANVVKVDLDVDFSSNMIVLIDKNIGNCFTARLMYYNPVDKKDLLKYSGELKVLHQRGKNARSIYNKIQSRLALVSLSDIKLPGSAIGYVEELLLIEHLDAYLKNDLIDDEIYSKLNEYITSNVDDVKETPGLGGFEFDRSPENLNSQSIPPPPPVPEKTVVIPKKTFDLNKKSNNDDIDIDAI